MMWGILGLTLWSLAVFTAGYLVAANNQKRLDHDYGLFCHYRDEFEEWINRKVLGGGDK